MEELLRNVQYKVVKVEFSAGTHMPRHFANSKAFVIVESGEALLIYKGDTYELGPASSEAIPAHEPHLLKVISDFKAFIILAMMPRFIMSWNNDLIKKNK
ncbi:cupin domain-containing protein [Mucilaginibacter flavidus]|uniref:cupin domain-containing protein n=1 Tax=Mucilaginibacter flavidus TaxID=2949309 RepID=UPI0020924774|nr:cupin domain-containing protein [Mucilaginibacter flavidus]MCO5948609.1 AraC family ligand binding domain-containing protein [Mucilaginibacter flavidus]